MLIHKFQFDAPVSALKSKNRISDSSDLWTGRIIKVPENPDLAKNDEVENGIDETPEAIGFIKVNGGDFEGEKIFIFIFFVESFESSGFERCFPCVLVSRERRPLGSLKEFPLERAALS